MDKLDQKTFKTSRGFTYNYYHYSKGDSSKPTVLICHGWPDDAYLWAGPMPYFLQTGFNLLVPDLLGFGGSSKPLDVKMYNSRELATDLKEILDHEKIPLVISMGHDWGSFVAQRLYFWYPDYVAGLILMAVAYQPPQNDPDPRTAQPTSIEPFDLQKVLDIQEKVTGDPLLAYWEVFTAPWGPELIENHLESFWCVLHGDQENWMKKMFCTRGALKKFLEEDQRVSLKPFAQNEELRNTWINRIKRDGIAAPLNYYNAVLTNVQSRAETDVSKDVIVCKKPVRFLGSTGDAVCKTKFIYDGQKAGWLPDLEAKEIEANHWTPLEKPDEVGKVVSDYIVNTKWAV